LVRRAVVDNVTEINIEIRRDYEKLLKDTSYANIEYALQNLATSYPKDIDLYLDIVGTEEGWRGKNIRIKWLEIAIGSGKKEYIDELKKYTSPSYEFETRINSITALKRLNFFDKELGINIIDAYCYWNFKVSNAAKEAMLYFNQQNNFKEILKDILNSGSINTNNAKRTKDLLKN
jgi:aminopeptidase N